MRATELCVTVFELCPRPESANLSSFSKPEMYKVTSGSLEYSETSRGLVRRGASGGRVPASGRTWPHTHVPRSDVA